MGFLQEGKLVEDVRPLESKVRQLAIAQFVNTLSQNVNRRDPLRLFGDEIEYMLINVDSTSRTVKLLPRAPHLLKLVEDARYAPKTFKMSPEYASYMIEGVPESPFVLDSDYLSSIDESFWCRRREMKTLLETIGCHNGMAFTFSSFPLLGCPDSVYKNLRDPLGEPGNLLRVGRTISQSIYTEDDLISSHIRFAECARNIRKRKGVIEAFVKAFQHSNDPPSDSTDDDSPETGADDDSPTTLKVEEPECLEDYIRDQIVATDPSLYKLPYSPPETLDTHPNDHHGDTADTIHMDTIVFGMGMCCLQLTFSCIDIEEARYLHDQLAVMTPFFMALTASTVVFRGRLAASDTRWDALCQTMDDLEAWEKPLVHKTRFSSASLYIWNGEYHRKNYARLNDNKVACLTSVYDALVRSGVDAILARHVAHIFYYQPLVIYDEDFDAVDCTTTDAHFEVFQSTNWNSVRFKPPPVVKTSPNGHNNDNGRLEGAERSSGDGTTQHYGHSNDHHSSEDHNPLFPIPWRVELRCCEIQLRDSENMALLLAIPYIVKVLLRERWNLYIPLSLVDLNIKRSSRINACLTQKFFVRHNGLLSDHRLQPEDRRPKGAHGVSMDDHNAPSGCPKVTMESTYHYEEMTLFEIFFGRLGLVSRCMDHLEREFKSGLFSQESYERMKESFEFIRKRCTGEVPTNATEIRKFILEHPEYKQDGMVNQEILFDLVTMLNEGERRSLDRSKHGRAA